MSDEEVLDCLGLDHLASYVPSLATFLQIGCGSQGSPNSQKEAQAPKLVCTSPANSQETTNQMVAAAEAGDADTVKNKLDCGADINSRAVPSSSTALMLAVQNGHSPIVRMLLDRGADVSLGQGGSTLLMSASLWGYSDIAGMVLEKGVDVNAKDANGKTAIYYASLAGNDDTTELLLQHGANKKQKTKESTNDFLKGTVTEVDAKTKRVKVQIDKALMFAQKGAEVPLDASEAKYFGVRSLEDLKQGDRVTVHYAMQLVVGGFNYATNSASTTASYKAQQFAVTLQRPEEAKGGPTGFSK
jgi:hypothetical protein